MELKNKKVLVTGADGFIGSHLVEALVKKGAQVKALYCYNAFNHWGWLEDIDGLPDLEVVAGDIRDSHQMKKITREVEVIFNLAALIAIPYSYSVPASYVETNVKIKSLVGYQTQYTLEKGLQETITWFKKNLEKYKVNIYNV